MLATKGFFLQSLYIDQFENLCILQERLLNHFLFRVPFAPLVETQIPYEVLVSCPPSVKQALSRSKQTSETRRELVNLLNQAVGLRAGVRIFVEDGHDGVSGHDEQVKLLESQILDIRSVVNISAAVTCDDRDLDLCSKEVYDTWAIDVYRQGFSSRAVLDPPKDTDAVSRKLFKLASSFDAAFGFSSLRAWWEDRNAMSGIGVR